MGRNRSSLDDGWGGPAVFRAEDGLKPYISDTPAVLSDSSPPLEIDYGKITEAVEGFGEAIRSYVQPFVAVAGRAGEKYQPALSALGDVLSDVYADDMEGRQGSAPSHPAQNAVDKALGHSRVQEYIGTIAGLARENLLAKNGIASTPWKFVRSNIVDPLSTIYSLVQTKVTQAMAGATPKPAQQETAVDAEDLAVAMYSQQSAQRLQQQERAQRQVAEQARTLMLVAMAGKLLQGGTWARLGHSIAEMGHHACDYCAEKYDAAKEFTGARMRLYPRLIKHYRRALNHWVDGIASSMTGKLETLLGKVQKFLGLVREEEKAPAPVIARKGEIKTVPQTEAFKRPSGTQSLVNRAAAAVNESQYMRSSSYAYAGLNPADAVSVAYYKKPESDEEAAAAFGSPVPLRPTNTFSSQPPVFSP